MKHIKDLSERFIPTVAVARAVLPITNDLATQFALPSKDRLIRTLICRPSPLRKISRSLKILKILSGMIVDQMIMSESYCVATPKC